MKGKSRTNKYHYSEGRACYKCGVLICNANKSGLCSICLRERRAKSIIEGSKYKTKIGYVMVRVNGVFVSEHTYIWEQEHGKLPKNWLTHHLNGIRDDNRIENLSGMPKKNHGPWTKLYATQERLREVEQLLENTQLRLS